jgi:hypothetical protein
MVDGAEWNADLRKIMREQRGDGRLDCWTMATLAQWSVGPMLHRSRVAMLRGKTATSQQRYPGPWLPSFGAALSPRTSARVTPRRA